MTYEREKPPAAGIAEGFEKLTEFYEPDSTTNPYLSSEDFQPGQVFVITEAPEITIARLCVSCSVTRASISFAERGELARRQLARAKGGRSE